MAYLFQKCHGPEDRSDRSDETISNVLPSVEDWTRRRVREGLREEDGPQV